jgi:hypothetical protein
VRLIDAKVPGKLEIDTGVMVSMNLKNNSNQLINLQLRYGLSIQSWPCGVPTDTEEAIEFAEMENIDCLIEKFPLVKANDAFGRTPFSTYQELSLTMIHRGNVEGHGTLPSCNHDGVGDII